MKKIIASLLIFGFLLFSSSSTKTYADNTSASYSPASIVSGGSVHIKVMNIPSSGRFIGHVDIGVSGQSVGLDQLNLQNCDKTAHDEGAWKNLTCSDDSNDPQNPTFNLDFSYDTSVHQAEFDQKTLPYGIIVAGNWLGPGFTFSDAPPAAFTIKSITPANPVKEGDALSIKLGNTTKDHEYTLNFNNSVNDASRTKCGSGDCQLPNFTVPPILNAHALVVVTDIDTNPEQKITANVVFTLSDTGSGESCKTCKAGDNWDPILKKCNPSGVPERETFCSSTETCNQGTGCVGTVGPSNSPLAQPCPAGQVDDKKGCRRIMTALGPISTQTSAFTRWVLGFVLSIAGGIVVLIIIIAGYRLMTSQGDPEKVKNAREQLTAAIIGLLFIIFSLVILQVITSDILGLPGFGG